MEFYERIKGLRQDNDLKQEVVAAYLGIARQQYGLYETGKRQFPVDHIIKLSHYFHVSADYILGLPEGLPYGHSKTRRK